MSRPPLKALEQIKNYCNKTQCRKCYFGERENTPYDELDFVGCRLQQNVPCDWEIDINEKSDKADIDDYKWTCPICGFQMFKIVGGVPNCPNCGHKIDAEDI